MGGGTLGGPRKEPRSMRTTCFRLVRRAARATATVCLVLAAISSPSLARQSSNEIRLVVRADDMGASESVNEACIESHKAGVVTSAEVIVPGPWFLDAVRRLEETPDLDVGVHL